MPQEKSAKTVPLVLKSSHIVYKCDSAAFLFPEGVKQGLGKALPNKIPMGQNERTANYGTSVESCSDSSHSAPAVKLRISPSAAYNDRKGILPKNVDNFFEKMGVKKRLAMQTAQKNIYLTYEKST